MKKLYSAIVIILMMLSLIACSQSRYNLHPDIDKKVVGSNSGFVDRIIPENMDQVVAHASAIIVGTVADNGRTGTYSYSGIKEVDEKYADAAGSSQLVCTLSTISVEEVIMGDIEPGSSITYFQVGKPGLDQCQTKVRQGDHILIMLRPSDTSGVYYAGNGEESVFYINKDNRLTAQSDFIICARYDGIPLDTLLEDIRATKPYAAVQNDLKK